MKPPTGAWTVRSWWFKLPNEGVADDNGFVVVETGHPMWEPARRHALHLTPCRGAVAVVVYDPFGDVFAHWDRFSNKARHLAGDRADQAARSVQAAWDEDVAEHRPQDLSMAENPAIAQASGQPIPTTLEKA